MSEQFENLFKMTVETQYVEEFKLNLFNSKKKDPYTGYIFTVFEAKEDWHETGLTLSIKFVKHCDVHDFLEMYELLPGTKLSEKIFIKRKKA